MGNEMGLILAVIGSAIATLAGGIGSALGIGMVAQAAAGVLREEPDRFGNLFLLVVLPGTQGFYGFIAAFLVIIKLGLLGAESVPVTFFQGMQILLSCMPVAFTGFFSAIYQARVCTAGVHLVARRKEESMKAVILAAMVETYAVLGLLVTFFMLNGIRLAPK